MLDDGVATVSILHHKVELVGCVLESIIRLFQQQSEHMLLAINRQRHITLLMIFRAIQARQVFSNYGIFIFQVL